MRNKRHKMKCKLKIHKEKIHTELTSSCQVKMRENKSDNIPEDHYMSSVAALLLCYTFKMFILISY